MVNPANLSVGDYVRFKPSAEHEQYRRLTGAPDFVKVRKVGSAVFWWEHHDGSEIPCSYARVKRAEGPW